MKKLRQFISAISEQALYYLALIVAMLAWGYFKSGYIALAVFIGGSVLAWVESSKIEGKDDLKDLK
jgi:hypothetical protein